MQRAVLRAAGFAWCVRAMTGPQSASRVFGISDEVRLTSVPEPHSVSRRDDTTGEMTAWPPEGSLALSPAAHTRRDTAPPTSTREVVDLLSPDERTAPSPTTPTPSHDTTAIPTPQRPFPSPTPHLPPIFPILARPPARPFHRLHLRRQRRAQASTRRARHETRPARVMIEALLRAWATDAATRDTANGDSEIVAGGRADERGAAGGGENRGNEDTRPGGARQGRRRRGEEGGPGEKARTIPLEDRLGVWIKSRPELYDRVLLMETVDVDDLLEALAEDARTGAGLGEGSEDEAVGVSRGRGVAVQQTRSRRGKTPGRGFDDRDASERGDSGSEVGRVLLHRTGVTFFAVLLQVLFFTFGTFEGVLLALARGLDTDTQIQCTDFLLQFTHGRHVVQERMPRASRGARLQLSRGIEQAPPTAPVEWLSGDCTEMLAGSDSSVFSLRGDGGDGKSATPKKTRCVQGPYFLRDQQGNTTNMHDAVARDTARSVAEFTSHLPNNPNDVRNVEEQNINQRLSSLTMALGSKTHTPLMRDDRNRFP